MLDVILLYSWTNKFRKSFNCRDIEKAIIGGGIMDNLKSFLTDILTDRLGWYRFKRQSIKAF